MAKFVVGILERVGIVLNFIGVDVPNFVHRHFGGRPEGNAHDTKVGGLGCFGGYDGAGGEHRIIVSFTEKGTIDKRHLL